MITINDQYFDRKSWDTASKVYENSEALVIHLKDGQYLAIDKQLKGDEYVYGLYRRSTTGNLKRCKKAFEKYSPRTMEALGMK